ncbi:MULTISPECIES: hypothetical protein [unclassified Methylobacterium]|uniref:hypothetical protein n=1 Tax=unclassified Methylobacterium TaxID=2615210 RepID=UPI0013527973|nr:hypothetical protein [Methylobacterium sp. 2A]MWV23360.1 hypothetical protein [Methylobacterium sp. 2A]
MKKPLHETHETAAFMARCARLGLTEADRDDMVLQVARAPSAGAIVRGSGGLRKVRWGGPGGYRILVAYFDAASPAVLMSILAKNQQANFTDAQIKSLHAEIKSIKDARRSHKIE